MTKKERKFWAKPVHESGSGWTNGEGSRWVAGWANWYINRGHFPGKVTASDYRRASWRRAI